MRSSFHPLLPPAPRRLQGVHRHPIGRAGQMLRGRHEPGGIPTQPHRSAPRDGHAPNIVNGSKAHCVLLAAGTGVAGAVHTDLFLAGGIGCCKSLGRA
jgi:hypothetical protein